MQGTVAITKMKQALNSNLMSVMNTVDREIGNVKNQLPLRFIYFVKVCQPKYAIIENVPGILTLGREKGEKESPFVKWIRDAFNEAGYNMDYKVHNAADYGVPQNRRRLVLLASLFISGIFCAPAFISTSI